MRKLTGRGHVGRVTEPRRQEGPHTGCKGNGAERRARKPQVGKRATRLCPAQLSCLANLVTLRGLQDDFELHPPDLLLFYE